MFRNEGTQLIHIYMNISENYMSIDIIKIKGKEMGSIYTCS